MSKSFKVDGGGIAAAVASTGLADTSLEVVPIEKEGVVVPEGSTQGRLELSLI